GGAVELMITEGRNAVLELIKSGKDLDKIYMEKNPTGSLGRIFAEARRAGVRVQFVDKAVLDKYSEDGRHQGVIAFGGNFEYADIYDIIGDKKDSGLVILCDGIEDVHNLGSIIRVAECVGADGVVIPSGRSASVTEAVVRISAGAANHVKVARCASVNKAIEILKKYGYWVYALEADGQSIYDTEISGSVALVIGGEDSGVRRLTREMSDFVVSLPLYGQVNSLNASVALGVAAYEVVRRRNV
ncbi:MAG: 23S rRNA (guanosine(2251)-2'-O)-methyltransferase RlmB, partial [Clostridia bacterium]|nr:23S rRNA (guanosine(2251)-2'-O)-methyltransferase RlmB [Clostridia bacterium]